MVNLRLVSCVIEQTISKDRRFKILADVVHIDLLRVFFALEHAAQNEIAFVVYGLAVFARQAARFHRPTPGKPV